MDYVVSPVPSSTLCHLFLGFPLSLPFHDAFSLVDFPFSYLAAGRGVVIINCLWSFMTVICKHVTQKCCDNFVQSAGLTPTQAYDGLQMVELET
jgi:hypothetical protein